MSSLFLLRICFAGLSHWCCRLETLITAVFSSTIGTITVFHKHYKRAPTETSPNSSGFHFLSCSFNPCCFFQLFKPLSALGLFSSFLSSLTFDHPISVFAPSPHHHSLSPFSVLPGFFISSTFPFPTSIFNFLISLWISHDSVPPPTLIFLHLSSISAAVFAQQTFCCEGVRRMMSASCSTDDPTAQLFGLGGILGPSPMRDLI